MPLPNELPDYRIDEILLSVNALLDVEANRHIRSWSQSGSASLFTHRDKGNRQWHEALLKLIYLQEEIDWQCYRLYRLTEEDLTYGSESIPVRLGERAFEIVMARKMAGGDLQTTWFERHSSTPVTELPDHWPDDYKRLVERRISLIESDRNIGLIEQPEYKRRWNTEPWDSQVERALRNWLLDRLEGYFDFDGRMSEEGTPTAKLDVAVSTIARLADVARRDAQFMEAGEVYRGDPAFDVQRLVDELIQDESVPLLPVLRYKPPGLRKRAEWEKTWELQRAEGAIDARTKLPAADPSHLTEIDAEALKRREVGDIPVPPKYTSSDFLKSSYWRFRGKLDVPKERWVSLPYWEGFVQEEARQMGKTIDEIKSWQPPKKAGRKRKKAKT